MADWHFFSVAAGGPSAGTIRDELDLGDVKIVDRLKGVGSLTAGISQFSPGATRANLDTENTLIVATRDGVVMSVCQLLEAERQMGSNTVALTCDGYWSFARARHIRNVQGMTYGTLAAGEVRFDQVDQFRIVADLVAHMQSIEDLGITVSYDALSGVLRDRSYEADKGKSVGEAIEQLSDVDNGFDWALEPGGTVDALTYTLRLSYPRRGRNTGFVFDLVVPEEGSDQSSGSGAVLDYSLLDSSRDMVTRYTAVGPGEGTAQLVGHAADPNLLGAVPLREASGAWLDVTNQTTLDAHALIGQRINGRRSLIVTLKLNPNADPKLGAYILGDTINLVSIQDGWASVAGPYRIIARTIDIDKQGREFVLLELAELGRF